MGVFFFLCNGDDGLMSGESLKDQIGDRFVSGEIRLARR